MRVLVVAVVIAGCSGIGDEPIPVWLPADTIVGTLRPQIMQPPVPEAPRDVLRIATYNTYQGVEVDRVAPALLRDPELARVDVLLLQETEQVPYDEPSDAAALAAVMGMGYVYAPNSEAEDGTRGLSILSRFPVRDVEVMYLADAIELGFNNTSARAAVAVVIDAPSAPLRIVNVHLDVVLNIAERILQLRPVVFDQPSPIVVGGDVNTNDYVWSDPLIPLFPIDAAADTAQAPMLDAYMRELEYTTPTASLGDTWHGLPESMRLDAIYTRGVQNGAGAVQRELDHLSDHRPLWLDIKIQP
jgi:endonuclease/exonuclease/phosphatase family metal-dependent hydrolase